MSTDRLADAMAQLRAGHFDALERMLAQMERRISGQPAEASVEDREKRAMMAAAMAEFSRTPGGAVFFDEMISRTLWRMVYPAGANGLSRDERADYAAMREGQNGMAYEMLRLVHEGAGDLPPPGREVM